MRRPLPKPCSGRVCVSCRSRPWTRLDLQAVHRVRERWLMRRSAVVNQIRGLLLERGLSPAQRSLSLTGSGASRHPRRRYVEPVGLIPRAVDAAQAGTRPTHASNKRTRSCSRRRRSMRPANNSRPSPESGPRPRPLRLQRDRQREWISERGRDLAAWVGNGSARIHHGR